MKDQANLDPWVYYLENRAKNFLEFSYAHGASDPKLTVNQQFVSVTEDQFVQYILDNEETCQKKWFHPRDILSPETNIEMALPVGIGLHQGNTFEYNWGLYKNTADEIKQLIGIENLEKIGYYAETVIPRLIVYMPGHGIPWHRDTNDAWRNKFSHLNLNSQTGLCDLGPVKRKLLMVSDWHWGQMLQIDNTVLTHWSSGDVFDIPVGQWHASANQGIKPKITISLTGAVKENQ
jgi:hypothetical protein